jgi:hypothetical protein
MGRADASRQRCAIYTRKSSEEGLEQEFNSLAAQREACEAFIRSQRNEGWVLAKTRYDDGVCYRAVGRRFRCTMRIDCSRLDPDVVIRPEPGEWHPRMPAQLDEEELADWRAGRSAVYQLAALTVGARLAVADASSRGEKLRESP